MTRSTEHDEPFNAPAKRASMRLRLRLLAITVFTLTLAAFTTIDILQYHSEQTLRETVQARALSARRASEHHSPAPGR
jgi:hypothetical protein